MRKRLLCLYWILMALVLFAGYHVGFPLQELSGGAQPVTHYDNFAYLAAAETLGGASWGAALYLWAAPALLVLLAMWQFGALRKLVTWDRLIWTAALVTSLVMTLGFFFAFTHHSRSLYGLAESATVAAGEQKIVAAVAALKAAGKAVPVTDANRVDLPKLMGYRYCPNATDKEQTCQWQFTVQNGYDLTFFNRDPGFRDLMNPMGAGLWIGWLATWFGLAANLYLWAAKTGDERIGIDLIYAQGLPSA